MRTIIGTHKSKRKNNSAQPHSPWQLLIEQARAKNNLTLDQVSESCGMSKSTLHARLTSNVGAPPRHKYSPADNAALARALNLTPQELSDAYDASIIRSGTFSAGKGDTKRVSKLRSLIKTWPDGTIPKEEIEKLLK